MKTSLFIATLLLPLSPLAGSGIATVPDRFIGQWAGSPDSCGSNADDMILRIAPGHIAYWESEGPIKAVVIHGEIEIALIAELSGEGETWLSTANFTLSQDGRQLIDNTSVPGKELVRYKCSRTAGNDPSIGWAIAGGSEAEQFIQARPSWLGCKRGCM
ncbi:hypothetical protein [Dokdonella koreensis]|uniref:hypothetical protein n=1 Tax=Dokdonella koreensis TaxID=323415 RepID=UPI00123798CE|nr:hypothetical protein [Dokdonella koreensis]